MPGWSPFYARHVVKLRFLVVGCWNTFFGYAVFFGFDTLFSRLMLHRYIAYLTAMALSNILAITNAYVFHKHITFRSLVKGKPMMMEFLRFCTTYLVAIFLSLGLMPVFVELLHLHPRVSAAIVTVISVLVSYAGHSRFSFASPGKRVETA
jgi:putative flippase GtrA